jgi:HK97 family phage portal protein
MGLLDSIFGQKNEASGATVLPVQVITSGESTTYDADAAMRITTVYRCVRLISDTLATLPIHVKRRMPDGSRITVYDHPVARLLQSPSPLYARIDFLRSLISAEELAGNSFAYIAERDKLGYPTRLDHYQPSEVRVMKGSNDVFYHIAPLDVTVPSRDVIHFKGYAPDGIEGKSPIALLRDEMENCANATTCSKELYKRDLRTAGVFSTDHKLGPEGIKNLFKSLGSMIRKAKTSATPIILEEGLKYLPIQLSPEDAQFVAMKLLSIDQVAVAFGVPPHKAGDLTRGTYSNNEQSNIEFYNDCLRPRAEHFKEELNRKLFLESERAEYYIDIDFHGLLRADTAARKDYYTAMFNIGVMSSNDIRALEDLPAYEGGDKYYVPVNLAPANGEAQINQKNGKNNE